MNITQVESTRNTTLHAILKPKHLLGTLLIGGIAFASQGHQTPTETAAPLQISTTDIDASLTQGGVHDAAFRAMLNLIILLLDEIIATQQFDGPIEFNINSSLIQTADSLMLSYDAFGLDSTLTTAEITAGLTDCEDALAMVKDASSDLSLTPSEKIDLQSTINLIIGELNSAF